MQLIDANALREHFKINEHCEDCFFNNKGHCFDKATYTLHDVCTTIDDVDVIDAIPVEWLEDRVYDMKRAPLYRRYAEMLLMEWLQEQKEQEAQE